MSGCFVVLFHSTHFLRAQDKIRLRWAIFSHYLLLFVMILKLTPEVLDRLDVFVLEVEELFVPAPLIWEWLWLLSVPVTFLGLNTVKYSSLVSCKQFLLGSLTCSLLPIIIGMVSHAQVCPKRKVGLDILISSLSGLL